MSKIKVLGHSSYIGTTGINNHFRDFFRALDGLCDVRVRNFTVGSTWSGLNNDPHGREPYITEQDKKILNIQSLWTENKQLGDFPIYQRDTGPANVHIVADIVDHYYFYQKYTGPKIAYTVWESSKFPQNFINKLKWFDEIWSPSEWQKENMVRQGLSSERIKIVPAGVDSTVFFPQTVDFEDYYGDGRFKFILLGRWSFRKGTKDIVSTFLKTFDRNDPVDLIAAVENWYPDDQFKSTAERLKHYGLEDPRIKILPFLSRQDYIKFIKKGHVFLSCSRGEGWNLPLIEAMACGVPSIYSDCSAQLEFAKGKGLPVRIFGEVSNPDFPDTGHLFEPDFQDLSRVMRDAYENYKQHKNRAMEESLDIRRRFDWRSMASSANLHIQNLLAKKAEPRKKKLLFIAPHTSTGGMPQFLLKRIEAVKDNFDVYCIEHKQIATWYVVQRNQILNLLGGKFMSAGGDSNKVLDYILDIQPDVIHFEEFPETFINKDILKEIYREDRSYTIFESYHGVYMNPNDKVFYPDKFLFVSEYQADLYKVPGVAYEVVEYPVENKSPDKKKYRRELDFEDGYKHVINVGLFTQGKNQRELVEYARLLQNEKIKFHFIGNQAENFSSYWKPIMDSLPNNCKIWGERTDVDKFYQAADLMVFTSRMETAPLVIKECISWGTPCLIYNLTSYKNSYSKYDKVKYLIPNDVDSNVSLIKNILK